MPYYVATVRHILRPSFPNSEIRSSDKISSRRQSQHPRSGRHRMESGSLRPEESLHRWLLSCGHFGVSAIYRLVSADTRAYVMSAGDRLNTLIYSYSPYPSWFVALVWSILRIAGTADTPYPVNPSGPWVLHNEKSPLLTQSGHGMFPLTYVN